MKIIGTNKNKKKENKVNVSSKGFRNDVNPIDNMCIPRLYSAHELVLVRRLRNYVGRNR